MHLPLTPSHRLVLHLHTRVGSRCAWLSMCAIIVVAAFDARAQGVPDARTGAMMPEAQAAAVEDSTSLLTNPAGLAFAEGVELSGGWLGHAGAVNRADTDVNLGVGLSGAGLGAGFGIHSVGGLAPVLRGSVGFGLGLGPSLAIGTTLHTLTPMEGGARSTSLADAFALARLGRACSIAGGVEGIGAVDAPASLRAGLSVRPWGELLTVGVDARVQPGSDDAFDPAWWSTARVTPGLAARVEGMGLALVVGGHVRDLGSATAPSAWEGMLTVEADTDTLGAQLLGGGGADATNAGVLLGGARARMSSAAWTVPWSAADRFLDVTLVGDGTLEQEPLGLIAQLFADEPSPLQVLAMLDRAADDPGVGGVVVRLRGLSLGLARAAELRAALQRVRAAGKQVIVHLDGGDDVDVFVASVADHVLLTPSGSLGLDGLRARMMYFGEALARLGIRAEAVAAGRYKSAPRAFTHDGPSDEELEVENALLDGAYATIAGAIAQGRKLSVDDVKAAIDLGGMSAHEALDRHIVDALAYDDEVAERVSKLLGHSVQLDDTPLDHEARSIRWDTPARIAIIPVVGSIQMGHAGGGIGGLLGEQSAGAADFIEALRKAVDDDDVRAIVLRIDSPGGDALASDLMWRAVMLARDKKPVIASMGDVAASGGYYLASAAQEIFAGDDTVTGSIGVFGLLFHGAALADKLGVKSVELARGARPGPDALRGPTDAERTRLQEMVNGTYEQFLHAVVEGRGSKRIPLEQLRGVAEGRVWTGAQARARGLVDREGGLLAALRLAREKAGLPADAPVDVVVQDGRGDAIGHALGVAQALVGGSDLDALRSAAGLVLGDPDAAAFVAASAGRPLALAPSAVQVE